MTVFLKRLRQPTLGLLLGLILLGCPSVWAQGKSVQSQPNPIDWHSGPFTAQLGENAQITIPSGYQFADAAGARRFLELTHNPPSEQEVGIVTPILNKGDDSSQFWFVLFDFDDTGYVKDEEKSSIDADKILSTLKDSTERGNEARKARGWSGFHLTGWQTKPFYDPNTHNLTWATLGSDENPKEGQTVNYATRILGRRGVMRIDLVMSPDQTAAIVPEFNNLLTGFKFNPGNRYIDFAKGDKVATYGLTALIAGGATAVAIKTGLLTKLLGLLAAAWKIIAVAVAAILTRIKSVFGGKRNNSTNADSGPEINQS